MPLYEIIWGSERRRSRFHANSKEEARRRFRGWHPRAVIKAIKLIRLDVRTSRGDILSFRW